LDSHEKMPTVPLTKLGVKIPKNGQGKFEIESGAKLNSFSLLKEMKESDESF